MSPVITELVARPARRLAAATTIRARRNGPTSWIERRQIGLVASTGRESPLQLLVESAQNVLNEKDFGVVICARAEVAVVF